MFEKAITRHQELIELVLMRVGVQDTPNAIDCQKLLLEMRAPFVQERWLLLLLTGTYFGQSSKTCQINRVARQRVIRG